MGIREATRDRGRNEREKEREREGKRDREKERERDRMELRQEMLSAYLISKVSAIEGATTFCRTTLNRT